MFTTPWPGVRGAVLVFLMGLALPLALLAGATCQGDDDERSLREQLRAELPGALVAIEARSSRAYGTGRMMEMQADVLHEYGVDFWLDGNRARCDRTWLRDGTRDHWPRVQEWDRPKGSRATSITTPEFGLTVRRGPREESPWTGRLESPGDTAARADVDYHVRKFLATTYGLGVPLRVLMADPAFAITEVRRWSFVGNPLVRMSFDYAPTGQASPFGTGQPPAARVTGWVVLSQADGWTVREIRITVLDTSGDHATRQGSVVYGDASHGSPAIRRVTQQWAHERHEPAHMELILDRLTFGAPPDGTFAPEPFGLNPQSRASSR
jgi:hypothetical protein